jgi:RNA polymerase Rpb1, domain 5
MNKNTSLQNLQFFDRSLDKGRLKDLLRWTFEEYGAPAAVDLAERLKNIGFRSAASAGISLGREDLRIPKEKRRVTRRAEGAVRWTELSTPRGAKTLLERSKTRREAWARASETRKTAIVDTFRSEDPLSPLYLRAFSGARGNRTQVRQLIGRRGLRVDPLGRVVEFPIRSNFKEGRTLTEFLLSCYGARKGIVDTALRTATAGYLTRRLVDVAHYQVIGRLDCGTRRALQFGDLQTNEGRVVRKRSERWIGRALARPIESIGPRNTFVTKELADERTAKGIIPWLRSPLACRAGALGPRPERFLRQRYLSADLREPAPRLRGFSLCQRCYGWSLADAGLVHLGDAVGVLAAQSIGEPGTQLTRRTFHTGGVFSSSSSSVLRASKTGWVAFPNPLKGRRARTRIGTIGYLTRESGTLVLEDDSGKVVAERELPTGVLLLVRNGQQVLEGTTLAEISPPPPVQEGELVVRVARTPQGGQLTFQQLEQKRLDDQTYRTDKLSRIRLRGGELISLPVRSKKSGSFPLFSGDRISPRARTSFVRLTGSLQTSNVSLAETVISGGKRTGFQGASYLRNSSWNPLETTREQKKGAWLFTTLTERRVAIRSLQQGLKTSHLSYAFCTRFTEISQPVVSSANLALANQIPTTPQIPGRLVRTIQNKQAPRWDSAAEFVYDTKGLGTYEVVASKEIKTSHFSSRYSKPSRGWTTNQLYPNRTAFGQNQLFVHTDSQGWKLRTSFASLRPNSKTRALITNQAQSWGEFRAKQEISNSRGRRENQLVRSRSNTYALQVPLGAAFAKRGSYCTAPSHVTRGAGSVLPGQLRGLGRGWVSLRTTTDWLLPPDSLVRGESGDLRPRNRPITSSRGRAVETGDITSGIPRVEALLEARERSGISLFIQGLYKSFVELKKGPRVAVRRSVHAAQRAILDNVQRIYRTNGVAIDDKHRELIVRPRAFGEVIRDSAWHEPLARGEIHPLEILERANQLRALYNVSTETLYPRIEYEPIVLGLTKASLLTTSESFLSAASFQETSRVLARAGVRGRTDYLLGLKENLILGTRLPIGTAARHLLLTIQAAQKQTTSDSDLVSTSPQVGPLKESLVQTSGKVTKDHPALLHEPSWLDALLYLSSSDFSRYQQQ